MKKEEFLAMSLPFGLKMYKESLHGEIETPYILTPEWLESALEFKNKPILHPLSDLTKECVQANYNDGKPFIPMAEISNRNSFITYIRNQFVIGINPIYKLDELPTFVTYLLVKWHFDISRLIEKGEAIDINTLPENPYK